MSTANPIVPAPAGTSALPNEIRVISHSSLFYWWPVWFFGLLFALWTYIDGYRLTIVPDGSAIEVIEPEPGKKKVIIEVAEKGDPLQSRLILDSKADQARDTRFYPKSRVSPRPWMGPTYCIILLLVIIITNVPMRGLWSLIAIISIVVLVLTLSLFELWDNLLRSLGDLHVFINMSGYLTISIVLAIAWGVAVYIFDRRTYMIFSPGQVQVCEQLGGREKTYDTTGMTVEKQRDDWFRHVILGFGTGDLIVKTSGADRHEILMPNVAFIGFKIDAIQALLRERPTTSTIKPV